MNTTLVGSYRNRTVAMPKRHCQPSEQHSPLPADRGRNE